MAAHLLHVVQHGDDRALLAMPTVDEGEEIGRGLGVDRVEGFIQQDDAGILQQETSEEHALELPDREGTDRPILETFEPDGRQRLGDLMAHDAGQPAENADPAPVAERHRIGDADREGAIYVRLLGQIGDVGAAEAAGRNPPFRRLQQADQGLDQGRLAGAIGPDHRRQRTRLETAGDMVHGRMAIIGNRQILDHQRGFGPMSAHRSAHSTAPQSSTDRPSATPRRAPAPRVRTVGGNSGMTRPR